MALVAVFDQHRPDTPLEKIRFVISAQAGHG
jgi:hypothetical protein